MAIGVPGRQRRMARSAWFASAALVLAFPLGLAGASLGEWHLQASPNPGGFSNFLFGASALSGHDIWAVGNASDGVGQQALAEHWDGVGWTAVPTPFLPTGGSFSSVAATSSCDVWAVGLTYDTSAAERSLIEHWDCNRWSVVPSPAVTAAFDDLNSVATTPAGDAWAVGFYENAHGQAHPLVEHLVNQQWQVVTSPQVGAGASLQGVAVAPDGTVWAAGSFTDPASAKSRTLILRFHDGHWTVIPGPDHGPGNNALAAVAVAATPAAAVQVAAVGSWYSTDLKTRGPLIVAWDGSRWRELPNNLLPSAPGSSAPLFGVALTGKGDVLAAGLVSAGGTSARTLIGVSHGGQVRQVPSPSRPPFDNELFGASIAPDGTGVVVGFNASTGGFQQTLIEAAG